MEEDLHGPGFDARGAAFPGVNLYVQLGHGRDYAWSATTATSDNVDTFAEVLCQDDFHYMYKGKCLAMDKLDAHELAGRRTRSTTTPPGSETLTAYRTVHGIVYARGKVHGKKVAFVQRAHHLLPRGRLARSASSASTTRASCTTRSRSAQAVDGINFAFNWAYIDSDHIAYQLSGWLPAAREAAPRRTSRSSAPGQYDWQGFDPDLHTRSTAAARQAPARRRPGLPRLLEQQAGAGLGGGRRQVRLRPGLPLADDRRPGQRGDQGRRKMATRSSSSRRWRSRRPQDLRGVTAAAARAQRRSASREPAACATRSTAARGWRRARRAPARPRQERHYDDDAGGDADGRLVAEAGRRRVQAGARAPTRSAR